MEHKHYVVSHTFLGDDHLLTPVNDEVATLVKGALLGVPDDFMIFQAFQVAELRSDHDWHPA